MSSIDAHNFRKKIGSEARLLGLDVGAKTIGVAVGSLMIGVASPVETLKRTKFKRDMEALKGIITDYTIDGLVVGYPFEMSGKEGRRCQSVRDFMAELQNHIKDMPYIYHDERLSTASVDNLLDKSVNKRKAKEKGLTDQLAAQVILQGFMDSV